MLTLQCSPVLSLQNGFSGESLGRSPLVCVSAGLHHSRRLRGGQVPQRVSASSLRPGSVVQSTCELIILKNPSSFDRDPDNVVMCILATDDEDVKDVALQIHFTLIQAFCCENDINILRVNNTRRLAEILSGGGGAGGGGDGQQSSGEPMDLHCLLVTVSVGTPTL